MAILRIERENRSIGIFSYIVVTHNITNMLQYSWTVVIASLIYCGSLKIFEMVYKKIYTIINRTYKMLQNCHKNGRIEIMTLRFRDMLMDELHQSTHS